MIRVAKDLKNVPASLLAKKIGDDVRERLEKDFNAKCCYCEKAHIKGEVEHFVPKSKAPHLEFDWGNLLWSCHDCNNLKGNKSNPIINPTLANPESFFDFDLSGNIAHKDPTAQNTIEICGLNRKNLNDKRKAVIDDFIRNLQFQSTTYKDKAEIEKYIISFFVEPINDDKKLSFVAFRRNIISNHLAKILSDL